MEKLPVNGRKWCGIYDIGVIKANQYKLASIAIYYMTQLFVLLQVNRLVRGCFHIVTFSYILWLQVYCNL